MQEILTKIDHVKSYLQDLKPSGFEGQLDALSQIQDSIQIKAQELTDALETRGKKVQQLADVLYHARVLLSDARVVVANLAPENTPLLEGIAGMIGPLPEAKPVELATAVDPPTGGQAGEGNPPPQTEGAQGAEGSGDQGGGTSSDV